MPKPTPSEIQKQMYNGELDENEGVKLLISYVESSKENQVRMESLKMLNKIPLENKDMFRIFEELMVSDDNIKFRELAAEIIIKNFLVKGLDSIKWVLHHQDSPNLLNHIFKKLYEEDIRLLRSLLLKELINLILGQIEIKRKKFKVYIDILIKEYRDFFDMHPMEGLTTEELMEIFLNFKTVMFIGCYDDLFYNLGWDLRDGYIVRLDVDGHYELNWKRISDIDGLINLTRLEELTLKSCPFEEIDFIENFPNLKSLDLSGDLSRGLISEIKNLDKLNNLEHVSLAYNRIKEIKGLKKLSKLKSLNLAGNQIEEIKGLEGLIELKMLVLANNSIREIKGLDILESLKILFLEFNKIMKIRGLKELKNLEVLELGENRISIIEGLGKLTNLKKLYLGRNKISKIQGLDNLLNLEELRLNDNQISILEGIENLKKLEQLGLNYNKIVKIEGLEHINHYICIHMENNNIGEDVKDYLEKLLKKKNVVIFY